MSFLNDELSPADLQAAELRRQQQRKEIIEKIESSPMRIKLLYQEFCQHESQQCYKVQTNWLLHAERDSRYSAYANRQFSLPRSGDTTGLVEMVAAAARVPDSGIMTLEVYTHEIGVYFNHAAESDRVKELLLKAFRQSGLNYVLVD